jgi:hypothetical protein
MIVDRILDRKDNEEFDGYDSYNAEKFYFDVLHYGKVGEEITLAMDYGTEKDVTEALCRYIIRHDYNLIICDYICSKKWLENALR